jgi:predicted DNA-binding protein
MKVVSFKLTEEDAEYLEYLSKKTNIPKSEIIRRALQNYMNPQKDKPFVTKRIKIYT